MFPSTNTNNNNNNFYNYRPFFNDTNPNFSKQFIDHQITPPDSNFFNLQLPSSPFNCYDDIFPTQNGQFLFHQQDLKAMENGTIFNFSANNEVNKNVQEVQTVTTKKRGSKKDRHSKINTAKGPRDRRMRLSLKVAREFFDLQDKLCFDKASKTVEWLLLEARSAIKKLSGGTSNTSCSFGGEKTASPTSECEVVSGIEDEPAVAIKEDSNVSKAKTKAGKKEKAKGCSRKTAFNPQAKESREKARAKARERTQMKIDESRKRELAEAKINGEFNQLSCWNIPCVTEVEAPITSALATPESITDESWAAIGKWSPYLGLSHIYNSEFLQEQNQMTDFQSLVCGNQYGSDCNIL